MNLNENNEPFHMSLYPEVNSTSIAHADRFMPLNFDMIQHPWTITRKILTVRSLKTRSSICSIANLYITNQDTGDGCPGVSESLTHITRNNMEEEI